MVKRDAFLVAKESVLDEARLALEIANLLLDAGLDDLALELETRASIAVRHVTQGNKWAGMHGKKARR